ncbi:helix-turn-helix transcriptional regulator [Vibrio sp. FNV 38]|nr:helix-turn-helix transcriptional regulator [Vibrio sp. FNV 38]
MKTNNTEIQTKLDSQEFPEALLCSSKQLFASYADYPTELQFPMHHHTACQLLYASKGVMNVETDNGSWIVPESHAVWIPSEMNHKITASGHLTLRSLYLLPQIASSLPLECTVVSVPSILRELLIYAADFSMDYPFNSHETRVMAIILDLLEDLERVPFLLPSPQDKRLVLITRHLLAEPNNKDTLSEWASIVGTSGRNISRLFKKETGLNFEQWRCQARLMTSVQRLASGDSVSTIAFDLGYSSVSTFIAMFKKRLGTTPAKYFKAR